MKTKKLAEFFHCSIRAVHRKADSLGLKKSREIVTGGGLKWTREQISEIHRVYKNHTARKTAQILGYPYESLRSLLHRFSISKPKPWTQKEDELIKRYYKKVPYTELAKKLGRNSNAVYARLYQLGLNGLIKKKHWNDKEIKKLKKEYKKGATVRQIASIFGRSWQACNKKISHLGL